MQSVILVFLMLVVAANTEVIYNCTLVEVNGLDYEKTVLKTGLDSPYQLAIDRRTDHLFFSYFTENNPKESFKSGYINLETNEFGVIKGISGGFANAVDVKNHVVYLGGHDGIYTFNFDTKLASNIGARNYNIWQLYSKDKLYFTLYPSEEAYIFEKEVSKKVPELVGTKALVLALDDYNNIFFSNNSGLFCYRKVETKIVKLGNFFVNGFANDVDFHIFFSTPDGIYAIDTNGEDVLKLIDLQNVYGVAIEADHSIIYSDHNSIVRLKKTKKRC